MFPDFLIIVLTICLLFHVELAAPGLPEKPVGSCKAWCAGTEDPWSKKCTWSSCSACDKCADTGPYFGHGLFVLFPVFFDTIAVSHDSISMAGIC